MSQGLNGQLSFEDASDLYSKYLKKEKMFFTKERLSILKAVYEMDGEHFSVDEFLFDIMKRNYKVSRATVYRCLSQLAKSGVLVEADFGHGHTHYELVGHENHEHIICKECGKVIEVDSDAILNAAKKMAIQNGFTFISHQCQIHGVCKECNQV